MQKSLLPVAFAAVLGPCASAQGTWARFQSIDLPSALDRIDHSGNGQTRTSQMSSGPLTGTAVPPDRTSVRQAQFEIPEGGFPGQAPAARPGDLERGGSFADPRADELAIPTPALPPSMPSTAPPPAIAPGARTLPPPRAELSPAPSRSPSEPFTPANDLSPVPPPRLGGAGQFATPGNCPNVSPPSGYRGVMQGCETPYLPNPTPVVVGPPAAVAIAVPAPSPALPATVLPPAAITTPTPLFSFGQDRYPVQIGQGWFGQPVAYVPGQTFRNWLRYLFP